MKVPFVDLAAQHAPLRDEIIAGWAEVLDATRFVGSKDVESFERAFAQAHNAKHCVAVNSGTDALYIAMRALGLGPGDRVVLPTNTFIATAEAVSMTGAVPLLVDCHPETKNIDVEQAADAMRQPHVRGVIGVHLYGQPADMDGLVDAADDGQWVLEDAAQAHLATYKDRPVGTLGTASAFSFYPGKNLGAPGEGGAALTNDDDLAAAMMALRNHGQVQKYHSQSIGLNARMSELVGSTLRVKLPRLAGWTEKRRAVAEKYQALLSGHSDITLPTEAEFARSVFHLYVVHVPNRDRVAQLMEQAEVSVGMHYPIPVHAQPAYASLGYAAGDFPVAEESARTLLSLPMYAELTDAQIEYVAEQLVRAVESARHSNQESTHL